MRKFYLLIAMLFALLLALLGGRFVYFRASQVHVTTLEGDLQRLVFQPFFTLGPTPVTPVLICTFILSLVAISIASSLIKRFVAGLLLKTHLDQGQRYAIEVGVGYPVLIAGILIVIESAGVNLSSLAIIGGAVGVGVGFGLQNIVNNFVSGLILLVERPIQLGDRVQVQNLVGDVMRIGARSTWVQTNDNIVIIVPNSEFVSNSVTNWTASGKHTRFTIEIGVAYESDLELVRRLLLQAAAEDVDVLKDPESDVVLTSFGDSAVNFALRVWTTTQIRQVFILKSNLYFAIHRKFLANNIELPFPQRDLRIRSAVPIPIKQL